MFSESQTREVLERFLERVLEPRLRQAVEAGEIATQADFDEALLAAALLRGVLDEWESDVKAELGYDALQPMCGNDGLCEPLTPEEHAKWLADVATELGVTPEQLSTMELSEIFRRIRTG
jgi:hypothetical protein